MWSWFDDFEKIYSTIMSALFMVPATMIHRLLDKNFQKSEYTCKVLAHVHTNPDNFGNRTFFNPDFFGWGLRGVYMRKLALARVSYRDEFLISFHISLFEGTLHVDKIHKRFKIANITHAFTFQSTGRPISHWNMWSFHVYMIPLRDFVPEWNSRPGITTGVNDSRRHYTLWW